MHCPEHDPFVAGTLGFGRGILTGKGGVGLLRIFTGHMGMGKVNYLCLLPRNGRILRGGFSSLEQIRESHYDFFHERSARNLHNRMLVLRSLARGL